MLRRNDLLDAGSPAGLDVWQLTTEALPSSDVYMEAQIFTPDSKRFLLHRSSHAHGSDRTDPEHRYLVCDLENHGELTPITHETGATAPSISPDGQFIYYVVTCHVHPFLPPDGRTGFFNSDETGTMQAYMVRGF
jgi:Tol biopolymer transport system component